MKRLSFFLCVFRRRLTLIVLTLVLFTASSVSTREWLRSLENVSSASPHQFQPETRIASQSESRRDRVEAEVITLLSTGFQPAQITRPRGRFLILIDNQSDSDDLTLKLDSVTGQRVREVRQKKEERLFRQLEDLPPGEYLLTASAGTEEWVCRITITPH